LRYVLTLSRTKKPAEYESVRVEYTQEFDDEETPREAGWLEVKAFVLMKITEELTEYVEEETGKVENLTTAKAVDQAFAQGPSFLRGLPQNLVDNLESNVEDTRIRVRQKAFFKDKEDWVTVNNHLNNQGFNWVLNGSDPKKKLWEKWLKG